jgi:hypothetical protein
MEQLTDNMGLETIAGNFLKISCKSLGRQAKLGFHIRIPCKLRWGIVGMDDKILSSNGVCFMHGFFGGMFSLMRQGVDVHTIERDG